METTFTNVTITIAAPTPEKAYCVLCDLFARQVEAGLLEYTTDTFSAESLLNHDTSELFPK